MKTADLIKNSIEGGTIDILNNIHNNEVNIAIYNRNIHHLNFEIYQLLKRKISLKANGTTESILSEISQTISTENYNSIYTDIKNSLITFSNISGGSNFKLLLATVTTNMCKRFHMDFNSLRLLCTYSGPGTLWLTEDNINREALNSNADNNSIVLNSNNIQQANTGDVIILKGANYGNQESLGIVHRSPSIEETKFQRLILRIDVVQ